MTTGKEARELIRQVQGWAGWRVEPTKNGWAIFPPDKSIKPIHVHRTESDWRAIRNTISLLKKAGAPL